MCVEDRKIGAREVEKEKILASLQGLMSWMETEMKSRMRATAPLRSAGSGTRHINQLLAGKSPKCWVFDTSTHWVDQCERFKSMSPEERLKTVRENHACFSCLKKAGREHRASNYIVADESSVHKEPTVTSASIIITFSYIQQIQQHLWVSRQWETVQKQCYQL